MMLRSKSVNQKLNLMKSQQTSFQVDPTQMMRKSMVSFLSRPDNNNNNINTSYKKRKVADFYKTISGPSLNWERTAEYDRVIMVIAKNRKLLM